MTVEAIYLAKKLSTFSEYWSPKIISRFNGHDVMVVKVKGEFVWHSHDDTDDFLCMSYTLIFTNSEQVIFCGNFAGFSYESSSIVWHNEQRASQYLLSITTI